MKGISPYNGDETEIYAYTLMPYKPSQNAEDFVLAKLSLISIIEIFMKNYTDCSISINEMDYKKWNEPFTHRVHVKITKI